MNNTVTEEQIEKLMEGAKVNVMTMFDKCTIVAVQLPNGFILVESSACVDKENYDEKLGTQICIERIVNKIWELEGYKLQCEVSNKAAEEKVED